MACGGCQLLVDPVCSGLHRDTSMQVVRSFQLSVIPPFGQLTGGQASSCVPCCSFERMRGRWCHRLPAGCRLGMQPTNGRRGRDTMI